MTSIFNAWNTFSNECLIPKAFYSRKDCTVYFGRLDIFVFLSSKLQRESCCFKSFYTLKNVIIPYYIHIPIQFSLSHFPSSQKDHHKRQNHPRLDCKEWMENEGHTNSLLDHKIPNHLENHGVLMNHRSRQSLENLVPKTGQQSLRLTRGLRTQWCSSCHQFVDHQRKNEQQTEWVAAPPASTALSAASSLGFLLLSTCVRLWLKDRMIS